MTTAVATESHRSSDRLLRTIARFVAAGYVIYGALLVPEFIRTAHVTASWWAPITVVTVFGSGLSMGVASFAANTVWIRVSGRTATFTFLIAALAWWPAWDGVSTDDNGMPLAQFPGLAGLAAAASLPAWLAFAQLAVSVVSVQLSINILRAPPLETPLFADIVFALMFCSIFVAATLGVLRTARILDSTIASTHQQAATAAALSARTVERERFDALIHDGVLSSLLAVSRQGRTEEVIRQTRRTLGQLDSLRALSLVTEFDADEAIAQIRSAATDADEDIAFVVEQHSIATYPADVVSAVSAALAEAVRNSIQHAGVDASRWVRIVAATGSLAVSVRDDGVGFDRAHVAPHRMGIAVSIDRRMRSLPGGSAEIHSTPGNGTVVDLRWSELP